MDLASELIESMLVLNQKKKWTLQAIEQLSEEDITWTPTPDSNSIANLVAHIRGAVHSRIETILFHIPDVRDREKEFARGLEISKAQALIMVREAFDIIIQYLEFLYANPKMLMSQPFINLPPLTYSQVNNETTGSATLSWTEKLGASRMKTSQLGADLLCQERDVHLQQNSKDKWFSYMKTGNQEQLL
ncbi:DUF1572 family protein [Paenibacillus sp. DMB20]|uniref:DUF1572 family protein n=1 Tax=Paenibacillus sp. DMB20 TaxID=1642570 RepID=UPI0006276DCD|nr:DUF1572 family protein [Paenibacillus sp. DMB20]KKO54657.1 hypothetical protein XI25_05500 [Paenibacillus sp. DMB20]